LGKVIAGEGKKIGICMKNVLVTGANRGIGLAFVSEYLGRGSLVIATCRKPSQAHRLLELRQTYRETLILLPMDVTDPQQIATCQAEVSRRVDALHLLINNAGILRQSEQLAQIEMQDLLESFQVNAAGPVIVAKAFMELLRAGAPSKLVNITMPTPSVSKWTRIENHAYIASRYAFNSLTKMLALELKEYGITTVGLYPGMIQTDMNQYSAQAVPAMEGIPKAVSAIENITPDQNGLAILPDGTIYDW
jgi:NAD(P)-dependent dehydrogenase (short-subunit alcohol dehydrogenase family)